MLLPYEKDALFYHGILRLSIVAFRNWQSAAAVVRRRFGYGLPGFSPVSGNEKKIPDARHRVSLI